jgi:hypothetical protein
MKRFSVLVLVVAVAGFVGCTNSSPTGSGPTGGKNDTFKITGFSSVPTFKQGETKNEAVKIDRGSDFKDDVKFSTLDLPKGITVEFDPVTVKGGDKQETTAKVTVAGDAPLGDATFKVIGTPTKGGTAVPLEAKVKVEKNK